MHQITSDLNSVGKSYKGSNFTEIYIFKINLYFFHIFHDFRMSHLETCRNKIALARTPEKEQL